MSRSKKRNRMAQSIMRATAPIPQPAVPAGVADTAHGVDLKHAALLDEREALRRELGVALAQRDEVCEALAAHEESMRAFARRRDETKRGLGLNDAGPVPPAAAPAGVDAPGKVSVSIVMSGKTGLWRGEVRVGGDDKPLLVTAISKRFSDPNALKAALRAILNIDGEIAERW